MHHFTRRVITLFVLISVLVSSLGMLGTVPVMAQAASQTPTASLEQQTATGTPTVEPTATAAATSLPATDEPASPTPTTEPASATPTSEPASVTPTSAAATDTPTTEAPTASPTSAPVTDTPTAESTSTTPTLEPTLTASPTSTPASAISASSTSYDCTAQTDIPVIECQALVTLYNSTGGSHWKNHTYWLVDDICTWYGVECDKGHVTGLWMWGNNMVGTLPSQLGNLTQITYIQFPGNPISGAIPTSFGNLIQLNTLDFSHDQLTGAIPTSLGNLTQLTYLSLQDNKLTGAIPTSIGSLTQLTDLEFEHNLLSGSIPTGLGNLTNLKTLDLSDNRLTGSIPTVLGNLTNLSTLWLNVNQLTGSIPTEFANLTNLTDLMLNSNKLTGSIPSFFGSLTNLTDLWLGHNQLTGSIPTELGYLTQLTELDLSNNKLSGSVPAELGNLTQMVNLFLDDNQLSGRLPVSLDNMTQLYRFFFNNTSLCEPNDAAFQTWLTTITRLTGTVGCGANIGGTVTFGSIGLKNVRVSLGAFSTLTTADGTYTLLNVPYKTTGYLTPILAGYTFSPAPIHISGLSGDLTGQDFSASQLTFTISGIVTYKGKPMPNVSVSNGTSSTLTGADGSYSFSGVPYGTNLVLTPSLAGYEFNPSKIPVNAIKSNRPGKNFTAEIATFTVTGKVLVGGVPKAGVTVSGGAFGKSITGVYGNYYFYKVPYGSNFTITPSLKNYIFTPDNIQVTNLASSLSAQNFSGAIITYSISGAVMAGSAGLDGVKVSFGPGYSTTTAAGGLYTFPNVPIGTAGTLTAFIPGYSITPAIIPIASLTGNLLGQNFSATQLPVTYSISGKARIDLRINQMATETGFAGVTISFGLYSAVTAADGSYTIPLIAPGTSGLLTASKLGFTFSPQQRTIQPIKTNQTGMNFEANPANFTIYGKVYSVQQNLKNVAIHITANGVPLKDGKTDDSGQYFLRNLPNGVTYVITPEKAGFTFSPSSVTLPFLASDSSDDFKATLLYENISGTVSGLGTTTVQIRYGTGKDQVVTTAADGSYAFNNLPQSYTYTLTPLSPLSPIFRFDPTSLVLPAGSGSTTTANFTATQQVVMSGKIKIQGRNLSGMVVSAQGLPFSTTTDIHGNYSLWVPLNADIIPTANDPHKYFTFTPGKEVPNTSGNFTQDWSSASVVVTGQVTLGGKGLANVVITASTSKGGTPASTITDANSGYKLPVFDTDTPYLTSFSVTPALTGYNFSPRTLPVSLTEGTSKNFRATAHQWSVSGKVTSNAVGLSGVEIDATIDGVARKLFTNTRGAYIFTGVPFGVQVSLSAQKTGFSFTPPTIIFSMGDADLAGQDFSAN